MPLENIISKNPASKRKSIHNIDHITDLETVIREAGVEKSDICLIGSTTLAYHNIRKNKDIDFVATERARESLRELADEWDGATVESDGQILFSDAIELSRPNRLDVIGHSDDDLIHDDSNHLTSNGYKILRLEILLARKWDRRRGKDLDDVELIKESGYLQGEDWNWDLVTITPPWDNTQRSTPLSALIDTGLTTLREEGILTTSKETTGYVLSRMPATYSNPVRLLWQQLNQHRQLWTADFTVESHYPVPDLLTDQFNACGTFECEDLICSILAMEGDSRFESMRSDSWGSQDTGVVVSADGKVLDGVDQLARHIVQTPPVRETGYKNTIEMSVRNEPNPPVRSTDWVVEQFGSDAVAAVDARREQLLEETGTAFYAILWPAIQPHADDIMNDIGDVTEILDRESYDIERGFSEFVKDLYGVDSRTDEWRIDNKIHELRKHGTEIIVLTLNIPDPEFRTAETPRLSNVTRELKYACRQEYQHVIEDYSFDVIVHMSDNFRQNCHISSVIGNIGGGAYKPHKLR
ncbi:hypothetical protein Har1130_04530 [Haloarcula sp. CBA1130]|uniref:hypothetical protein n=1 Tax=unclassified Haloarcula TaxID=2624677 RepID=UPI001247B244|nr:MULTISPECIES: hypothetical protein [unclassified Haloarcula]KAA9398362.1 hypothetical protein Har1129_09130 [Haloarcula sp. CBA1129]KAA9402043.1 hypothetical protein Har1130_04530 [Haloarcula sp. CBA1130]